MNRALSDILSLVLLISFSASSVCGSRNDHSTNASSTYLNNDLQIEGKHSYQEVLLIKPVVKSSKQAVLNSLVGSSPESDTGRNRHLEWLDSSSDNSESAGDEGFFGNFDSYFEEDENDKETESDLNLRQYYRKKYEKTHKIIYPLLLAYKLKFFTLIPVLFGALTLLVGTTGLAGFFFAMFAAAAGLPPKGHRH